MKNPIAYCGLDCRQCDAYLATVHHDEALREKTAKLWSELNQTPITPEDINCEGCRCSGAKTVFCQHLCGIRKCAAEKGIANCGQCPGFEACPTLGALIANNPDALKNLNSQPEVYDA